MQIVTHNVTIKKSKNWRHKPPWILYILVLWRLPNRNRKPCFFCQNRGEPKRRFFTAKWRRFCRPTVRRLYLYSVKLHEQTNGQTYKYARQQRPSAVNLLLSVRTSHDVIASLLLAVCFCLVQTDYVCALYLMITEAFFNDFCFFVLFVT